jgi:restriction endonuclease S subunit
VFAVKRGEIEGKGILCNPLYPYYLELIERYKKSPFYKNETMKDYIFVNPRTDTSDLTNDSVISFVPMLNVEELINQISYDNAKYEDVKTGFTVFRRGDLIWAKITPCMQNGKSAVTDLMPTEIGFGSTEFHVLRPKTKNIFMPFIWSVFSNTDVLTAAQATLGGSAGQQRVPATFLEDFPAVLPDYQTQTRLMINLNEKLQQLQFKLREADNLLAGMDEYVLQVLGIDTNDFTPCLAVAVNAKTLKADKTFGAQYYHPERMAVIHALEQNTNIQTKKLSETVTFERNRVNAKESGLQYLGLAGVVSNTGELSGTVEEAAGQAFSYQSGDVLYGRLRPYLNKVLLAETGGICSTEFHVMRVFVTDALPEYIAVIMRSRIIVEQTKHMMTGNTHPRISNDDVRNLRIPIPKRDVQNAIVAEMKRRKTLARQLKQEAERDWAAAKVQFEKELLGE